MIDKNAIELAIQTKLEDSLLLDSTQIGYGNVLYTPAEGETLYVIISIIPAVEKLQSRCEEMAIFAIDIDVYVIADSAGTYTLRDTLQDIGELYNPKTLSNARWVIGSQVLNIISTEEVQGAKTDDGWYYSTLRLNLKVSK